MMSSPVSGQTLHAVFNRSVEIVEFEEELAVVRSPGGISYRTFFTVPKGKRLVITDLSIESPGLSCGAIGRDHSRITACYPAVTGEPFQALFLTGLHFPSESNAQLAMIPTNCVDGPFLGRCYGLFRMRGYMVKNSGAGPLLIMNSGGIAPDQGP